MSEQSAGKSEITFLREDIRELAGKLEKHTESLTDHRIKVANLEGRLGMIGVVAALVSSALFAWLGRVFFS